VYKHLFFDRHGGEAFQVSAFIKTVAKDPFMVHSTGYHVVCYTFKNYPSHSSHKVLRAALAGAPSK
jgi:hypothetical protein